MTQAILSQRLREIRNEAVATQQEVADHLGITRQAYAAYETGSRQPDLATLAKLAKYFGVTTDWLLGCADYRSKSSYQLDQPFYFGCTGALSRASQQKSEEAQNPMNHELHCILVEIPEYFKGDEELLIAECRQEALGVTDGYYGQAFESREDDAGLWAEDYPNRGVVLGSADPGQFRKLLARWKDKPFIAAKEALKSAQHAARHYRTLEELAADGAVCLETHPSGGICLSGIPVCLPPFGPELLQKLWESNETWHWSLVNAIALAVGDYRIGSKFYSSPDESAKISPETLREAIEVPEKYALVFLDYQV
jgi:transcriptional regulator with XRE-family HTH domain